jgi:hypothetical protein
VATAKAKFMSAVPLIFVAGAGGPWLFFVCKHDPARVMVVATGASGALTGVAHNGELYLLGDPVICCAIATVGYLERHNRYCAAAAHYENFERGYF